MVWVFCSFSEDNPNEEKKRKIWTESSSPNWNIHGTRAARTHTHTRTYTHTHLQTQAELLVGFSSQSLCQADRHGCLWFFTEGAWAAGKASAVAWPVIPPLGSAVSFKSINQKKANPVNDLQKTGLRSWLPVEEGFWEQGRGVHRSDLRCFDFGGRTFVFWLDFNPSGCAAVQLCHVCQTDMTPVSVPRPPTHTHTHHRISLHHQKSSHTKSNLHDVSGLLKKAS